MSLRGLEIENTISGKIQIQRNFHKNSFSRKEIPNEWNWANTLSTHSPTPPAPALPFVSSPRTRGSYIPRRYLPGASTRSRARPTSIARVRLFDFVGHAMHWRMARSGTRRRWVTRADFRRSCRIDPVLDPVPVLFHVPRVRTRVSGVRIASTRACMRDKKPGGAFLPQIYMRLSPNPGFDAYPRVWV